MTRSNTLSANNDKQVDRRKYRYRLRSGFWASNGRLDLVSTRTDHQLGSGKSTLVERSGSECSGETPDGRQSARVRMVNERRTDSMNNVGNRLRTGCEER